ncbi:4-aminobutyrate--2-oxoglutarate transaminase [Corynebacterium felinum]|uniref:(S)-3-amino-2-methylpropionate transaminase n=1 Tax=Corynebacterium felinum TaxID=131318 RepID=A0ABU2B4L6_9CORY|nr:4-aminobutyrate--2-oxoglutarate transaminase [Corynebacterium felinum]MDF5820626.1 4-aminobutyrate--2-oxoglutarate transaminase [Corynebacterium felinum]MDR7353551.1 4-aminobutyrate aminotransferase/(S)-3-amino-2-methylpropionate transaminase [Corynebacterium felinum]WJY95732.1 4-aminobutyrate aminotransferase GabT [Corynebacterium felinum]
MKELTYRLPQKRTLTGTQPGPASTAITARREKAVAKALQPGLPGYVVDADGGVLVDIDGNSYIDFASGIAVTSVGASNPAVATAVAEAASHFTHTCFMVSPYESYVEVAEKLNELTPGDHEKKSVLLNSGAEAVENAVKIARAYTGRNAVIVFDYAYHGRTNLTMAMTAKNKPYKTGFGPFAAEVYRAPMSYPLRDGLSGNEAAQRAITKIEQEVGVENIACLVIEPIQGEGGFIVPAEGFLPALKTWCEDNNIVFVADEIQAGFARTGAWFACEHEGVVPDLITTAKGIAGGMPLSAVTGRAEIMDAPVVGGLGGTYGGNPVTCAAALASFEQMKELDLVGRAKDIEAIIREELSALDDLPVVAEVRGRGAMVALELVNDNGKPHPTLTAQVAAECKKNGVLILTCGLDGNVIRLLPALVIPEALLREGLRVLVEAIRTHA